MQAGRKLVRVSLSMYFGTLWPPFWLIACKIRQAKKIKPLHYKINQYFSRINFETSTTVGIIILFSDKVVMNYSYGKEGGGGINHGNKVTVKQSSQTRRLGALSRVKEKLGEVLNSVVTEWEHLKSVEKKNPR